MTAIMRLPSAQYVIERVTGNAAQARDILDALHVAGWRLVPGRRITHNENGLLPVMVEGHIRSADILYLAQEFDQLDEDLFTACEFAHWMTAEVRGSPEFAYLERKASR